MGKHHGSSRYGGHRCGNGRQAKQKDLPKLSVSATHTGTVRFFNPTKGWGFIRPDATKKTAYQDVFIHISQIEAARIGKVDEGHRLKFTVGTHRGHEHAINLERTT